VRFTVRNYRPADFETLLAIDQSCFAPGIAYTPFELRTYITRRGCFTFIAETDARPNCGTANLQANCPRNSAILGFIVAERNRGNGHIITIDVRSEARRQGIGSVLLEAAEEQLRLWNCRTVRLETAVDNISALCFYKRRSFNVVTTIPRYYSNAVDALLLEKDLLSLEPSS